MKKTTLIIMVVTLSSLMFARVHCTWGSTYNSDAPTVGDGANAGAIQAVPNFGVWFDVNDGTAIGWNNSGLMVALDGPGASSIRLGYNGLTSVGTNWNWWDSGGDGWGTTVGTAVDFTLTGTAAEQGRVNFTVNLGFGI